MEFKKIQIGKNVVIDTSSIDKEVIKKLIEVELIVEIDIEDESNEITTHYMLYEDYQKISDEESDDYFEEDFEEDFEGNLEDNALESDLEENQLFLREKSNVDITEDPIESIIILKKRIKEFNENNDDDVSNLFCANTFAHLINIEKDIKQMHLIKELNNEIIRLCRLSKGDFDKYTRNIKKEMDNARILREKNSETSIYRFFGERNGKHELIDGLVGEEILNENHFFHEGGIIYMYKDGKYHTNAEKDIEYSITEKLGSTYFNKNRRDNIMSYVISIIKVEFHIEDILANEEQKKMNETFINLKNGLLHVGTKKMIPHTHKFLSKNQLPIEYNKNADKTFAKQFFRDVLEEDTIPLVEEYLGYCLTTDMREQKAILYTGEGSNGKSVLIEFARNMLGEKNTTSITLKDIDGDKFKIIQLKDKLLNVGADISGKRLDETEAFKKSISGDAMSGEYKGKDSFTFKPYAKHIYSANSLPPTADVSDGFFRRWIIIPFNNSFIGREDKNIFTKITNKENLEGLFLIAFEGLQRLRKNGAFTKSETSNKLLQTYKDDNKIVKKFFNEECVFLEDKTFDTDKDFVTFDDLFSEYEKWCDKNGFKNKNRDNMMKDIYRDTPVNESRKKRKRTAELQGNVLLGVIFQKNQITLTDEEKEKKEKLGNLRIV